MKVNIDEILNPVGISRLTEVIEWLERGARHFERNGAVIEGFDMGVGVEYRDCGAVCCIAGALCQFNEPFEVGKYGLEQDWRGGDGVRARAARLLGFDCDSPDGQGRTIAVRLFRENRENDHITAAVAAATLRHFLATGELDWPEPEEEED